MPSHHTHLPWSKAMSAFCIQSNFLSYFTYNLCSFQFNTIFFHETFTIPKDMAVVRLRFKKNPKQTSELRKKSHWGRKLGTLLLLDPFEMSNPNAQVQDTLVKRKKESVTLHQCRINWTGIDSISTWAFTILIFLRNWRSLEYSLRFSLNCFCPFH